MDGYVLPLRIFSSVLAPIGAGVQASVLYLVSKKHHEHECRGYELFMKVYSVVSIVRLFLGWLAMSRVMMIPGGVLIFIYGPAGRLSPAAYSDLDLVSRTTEICLQFLVPLGMILRALLARKLFITKGKLGFAVFFLFTLVAIPYMVLSRIMFTDPINFRNNLTLDDWEYLRNYDGYGILLDLEWVNIVYNFVCPNLVLVCHFVTLLVAVPTYFKLKSTPSNQYPERAKISFAQLKLLLMYTLMNGIYSIEVIARLLIYYEIIPIKEISPFLSTFNFPLVCLIPTIQGILTMILIPYLKKEIVTALEPKKKEDYFPTFVHIEHIEIPESMRPRPRSAPARTSAPPRSSIEEAI